MEIDGFEDKKPMICDCCGREMPSDFCSFQICGVCGWQEDSYQAVHPDEDGANDISLNEARKRYKETGRAYPLNG